MSVDRVAVVMGRRDLVKICGLREPEHAAVAARAGADLIGFIFAPARRRVSADVARACVTAARGATGGRAILAVGVFVDAPAEEIVAIAGEAGLDVAQLHGDEPPDFVEALPLPAIKALRPLPRSSVGDAIADIERHRHATRAPVGFLIDGYTPGSAGGAGEPADWRLAAEVNATRPILLAGGLDPENVGAAIRQVRPLGVDVSSGVEVDGEKRPERIEAFIREARAAFAG
ncbi:MAG: phosphoribosylanthranilate isomerase [Thermomicrobiales bacterium]|nr:phosphoribosylanthranilate isomerase [Thermomicrobiales bacterium]